MAVGIAYRQWKTVYSLTDMPISSNPRL